MGVCPNEKGSVTRQHRHEEKEKEAHFCGRKKGVPRKSVLKGATAKVTREEVRQKRGARQRGVQAKGKKYFIRCGRDRRGGGKAEGVNLRKKTLKRLQATKIHQNSPWDRKQKVSGGGCKGNTRSRTDQNTRHIKKQEKVTWGKKKIRSGKALQRKRYLRKGTRIENRQL